ncbi:MAG: hypothetical protein JWM62_1924 [Frankiales bacterium]|nr:hypothetical protein [Frankiales bacterium]
MRSRLSGWRPGLAVALFVFVTSWALMVLVEPADDEITRPGNYWWYPHVQCVQWHLPFLLTEEATATSRRSTYDLTSNGGHGNTYSTRVAPDFPHRTVGVCPTWFGQTYGAALLAVREGGGLTVSPPWGAPVQAASTLPYGARSRVLATSKCLLRSTSRTGGGCHARFAAVHFEHLFERLEVTVHAVLDAPPGWLTAGDPGPFPWPEEEPAREWSAVPLRAASAAGLLDGLEAALDAVATHGPLSGSRADTARLLALAERARALALRELAEMDAVGGHLRPGVASTTASWLRDTQRLGDGAARATVRLATALRDDLPRLADVLQQGSVTVEHAAAVVAGVRGLDRDTVREAEDALCALAQVADPVGVRTRLRDKASAVDDRLAAEAERRARERMGLRLHDVGAHTAVDGTLAGDDGATVRLAMDLAVGAAREDGDVRGRAARQADVLVDWARDYLTRRHGAGDSAADDARTVRTHLHVLCRPEQLEAALSPGPRPSLRELLSRDLLGEPPAAPGVVGDTGPLSRGALRRLACDAVADLAVLTPGRTDLLYVGRAARLVSGRLFRALVVRDRKCVVRGCRRRPAQCAAHHVRHWADGGATDIDNLVLLCHQHHHDHHDRGLDLPHDDGRWLTQRGWAHAPP